MRENRRTFTTAVGIVVFNERTAAATACSSGSNCGLPGIKRSTVSDIDTIVPAGVGALTALRRAPALRRGQGLPPLSPGAQLRQDADSGDRVPLSARASSLQSLLRAIIRLFVRISHN